MVLNHEEVHEINSTNPTADEVDHIVAAWEQQRPDFDARPLAVFSRLLRLGRFVEQIRRSIFGKYSLETWEFEMLAALRRTGAPHQLTAGQLMNETLVTSGTITNRIDQMEKHGYVVRNRDEKDRRVVYVKATAAGIAAIDAAMSALLAVQHELLAHFSADEEAELRAGIKKLLEVVEQNEAGKANK
ncbi:MarR family winged helix-turn-helix transcriptional regulator [Arcanobacterium hippocoleae]|uniref:MarR family winged helix-turn-helix transcriptional regulator n=1 Tax=Arcanobacterium hippocoleae TaxID=149017 RepID=UPI00333EAD27